MRSTVGRPGLHGAFAKVENSKKKDETEAKWLYFFLEVKAPSEVMLMEWLITDVGERFGGKYVSISPVYLLM